MPATAATRQPAGRPVQNKEPTKVNLEDRCRLHPQVALRTEPFGALAYHYGNRRLVFLKHVDMVGVLSRIDTTDSLREALTESGIDPSRWPSFVAAIGSLTTSEIVSVG